MIPDTYTILIGTIHIDISQIVRDFVTNVDTNLMNDVMVIKLKFNHLLFNVSSIIEVLDHLLPLLKHAHPNVAIRKCTINNKSDQLYASFDVWKK